MKKTLIRFLSVILCASLLLGNLPPVLAVETSDSHESQPAAPETLEEQTSGQFALAVLTADAVVIEPTYILYAPGQTVAQALLSSGYEFVGLLDSEETSGWIEEIEGVCVSYSLFYDDNGADLTVPAQNITALCITEKAENYSAEYLELIKTMADYNTAGNGVETYAAAQEAYAIALRDIYAATPERAVQLNAGLQEAMDAYEQFISGEQFTLTLKVPGVTTGTITGQFGNSYDVTEKTEYLLPPGEYTFDLSDGGRNHIKGSITVTEDTVLETQLPAGQWLQSMDLSICDDNSVTGTVWTAVEKLDEWTFAVPDYAGVNLYPYFEPEEGLDLSECGMYWGDGAKRGWRSHKYALPRVIEANSMAGTQIVLEARQEYGEYVQYQTYPITIVRVPSLSGLDVYSEGTRLPLAFAPETREYTLTTTGSSVDLYPQLRTDDGITLTVNGEVTDSAAHIPLSEGITPITVQVSHQNGQSSSYTLNVEQIASVSVRVETSADSVAVYNAAGAEIIPVGGVYALVPGEVYTYVTTSDAYFHTGAAFTASEGLTVHAPAPNTDHALTSLKAAAAYRADPLESDREFAPEYHEYVYQAGSNETSFGILAELAQDYADEGYVITALYENWKTGELVEKEIVSPYTSCIMFLSVSGYPNTMTLRIHKEVDGVSYYQEYILTAQRRLQLNDMSLVTNGQELVLNQAGGKTGFSKFVLDYHTQVGQTMESLKLNLKLFSTSTGQDNGVSITVSAGMWSTTLDYADLAVEEIQTLTVPLDIQAEEETLKITLTREGATSQTYTVTVEKLPPVKTQMIADPATALIHLTDDVSGNRVLPEEDGTFILSTGRSYTYVVTHYGYIAASGSFLAGEDSSELTIALEKAPENELKDISADTDFLSFRGNDNNNGVINAPTPIVAENAVLNWANKIGEGTSGGGVGSPIIVGGDLYTYAASTLFRLDKETGEVLASAQMDHASSFSITPPAYGEGMIFVALANGGIQAFNAQTLESLWVYRDPLSGQPNCPVAYREGYLYTGFWNAEEKQANYVCISVTDEDPSQPGEQKLASWTYTHNGFYWAGAYVTEAYLLVTTDDGSNGYTSSCGTLLSMDPRTGLVIDSLQMPGVGDLRSSVCYDEATDAFYFTSKGGDFYSIKVEPDGTFREGSLKSLHLTNGANSEKNPPMSTSTPVVYNGRAYIGVSGTGQFVSYSGHNITVIDLNNWRIAYTVPTQGYPQTSGLLTTAYEGDREYVYVYFLDNYTPGKLRVIRDTAGQNSFDTSYSTTETYVKSGKTYTIQTGYVLFTPSGGQAQYAICSPIADEFGNLYFKNDSGYLMCVGSTIESLVISGQPEKLVYEVGMTFDASGLGLTAVYSNGIERDVTQYAVFSTAPLTAEDTEFTVMVDFGTHQMMYQNRDGETGVEYYIPTATLDLTIHTDHIWDEGTIVKEPTGSTDGEKRYVCTLCGEEKSEIIPATGIHTWDDGVITKEPTCGEAGVKTYTCLECGETMEVEVEPTGLHIWDEGEVILEPTEETEGQIRYTCTVCGAERTESMEKLPPEHIHSYGQWTVWKDPSSKEEGELRRWCDCGVYESQVIAALTNPFRDVKEGSYCYEPILWAAYRSIAAGTSATEFSPEQRCTRGQVVTFLWRAMGCPEPSLEENPFSDVKEGAFYYKAVLLAVENGITSGTGGGRFSPDQTCTRGQVVTFLWRVMGKPEPVSDSHPFRDVKQSAFYYNAMLWAVENGITAGTGATTFAPELACTRGQVVTFLYRTLVCKGE